MEVVVPAYASPAGVNANLKCMECFETAWSSGGSDLFCSGAPEVESQTESPDSAACPGDVMACSVVCKLTHLFNGAAEDGNTAKRDQK